MRLVGFEPLRPIDPTQLTDSNTHQKRQKGQIPGIEVHARYTARTRNDRKTLPYLGVPLTGDYCHEVYDGNSCLGAKRRMAKGRRSLMLQFVR